MKNFVINNSSEMPLARNESDEAWLCCLRRGSIEISYNYTEYNLSAEENKNLYFLLVDGIFFKILSATADFELKVIVVDSEKISLVYPSIGGRANDAVFCPDLVTSKEMEINLQQLIACQYRELEYLDYGVQMLEQERIETFMLSNIFLSFYNGIAAKYPVNKISSTSQSFGLMCRFSSLFIDRESFRHRDTAYFADKLNVSVRYLFQVCKCEAGKSPKDLINETIVSEIKHTILNSNLSFQQISNVFAFPDAVSFTQYFKRNTGLTPKQFRQKYL